MNQQSDGVRLHSEEAHAPRYLGTVPYCPKCGTAGYEEDRFCPNCGAPLVRRCPHCQAEIRHAVAYYCSICGASL